MIERIPTDQGFAHHGFPGAAAFALAMPWAPTARAYCAPRRVTLKLALGEAPSRAPTRSGVRRGLTQALGATGHGAVDRILKDFAGAVRLSLLHDPADGRAFDTEEHVCGAARTFVAEFSERCRVDELVDALCQTEVVDSASLDYFVLQQQIPVAAPMDLDPPDADEDPFTPWRLIGADQALRIEPGDHGVLSAVLDTGAAKGHEELRGRLSHGFDAVNFGAAEIAQGLSLVGDYSQRDVDPSETRNPHGTACLALVGGSGRRMPPGLGGATRLMPVRTLASAQMPGKSGKVVGLGALSDIDYALKRTVDLGAKVLNCSFGTAHSALGPTDPTPHADTIAYALTRGTVLVAASGNSGDEEIYYPAAVHGVIAVGSVNGRGQPSSFSNRGKHVALCAPGERVLTPGIQGYQRVTGTSFAAPFAAGTVALMVARATRRARPISGPVLRQLLSASARPFATPVTGCGAGVLDAPAALAALDHWMNRHEEPGWEAGLAPDAMPYWPQRPLPAAVPAAPGS